MDFINDILNDPVRRKLAISAMNQGSDINQQAAPQEAVASQSGEPSFFQKALKSPLVAQYLLSMGAGMMGQPTFGAGLAKGVQMANAGLVDEMNAQQDKNWKENLFNKQQEAEFNQGVKIDNYKSLKAGQATLAKAVGYDAIIKRLITTVPQELKDKLPGLAVLEGMSPYENPDAYVEVAEDTMKEVNKAAKPDQTTYGTYTPPSGETIFYDQHNPMNQIRPGSAPTTGSTGPGGAPIESEPASSGGTQVAVPPGWTAGPAAPGATLAAQPGASPKTMQRIEETNVEIAADEAKNANKHKQDQLVESNKFISEEQKHAEDLKRAGEVNKKLDTLVIGVEKERRSGVTSILPDAPKFNSVRGDWTHMPEYSKLSVEASALVLDTFKMLQAAGLSPSKLGDNVKEMENIKSAGLNQDLPIEAIKEQVARLKVINDRAKMLYEEERKKHYERAGKEYKPIFINDTKQEVMTNHPNAIEAATGNFLPGSILEKGEKKYRVLGYDVVEEVK